jgi:hypothetical protein
MSPSEYAEHACSLARSKLRPYNNMPEETEGLWDQVISRRHIWNEHLDEVSQLRHVTKEGVLDAYRRWLLPGSPNRRVIDVRVQGVPRTKQAKSKSGDDADCEDVNSDVESDGGSTASGSNGSFEEMGIEDGDKAAALVLEEEASLLRVRQLGKLLPFTPQVEL